MFASMKGILEGYNATQEHGFFHLITESPCVSATHVVSYHLINAITTDKKIAFLALQNSWSHYCEIANKFGINLRSKQFESSIKVLNSFKLLMELVEGGSENLFSFITDDNHNDFKKFALHVLEMIKILKESQQPVVLIIDSITPLLNLGVKEYEIMFLINLCFKFLSKNHDHVVVAATDEDNLSDSLIGNLRREASICLSVRGLSTGISQDVFGEIIIYTSSETFEHDAIRKKSNHRYKIENRDVKLFPAR